LPVAPAVPPAVVAALPAAPADEDPPALVAELPPPPDEASVDEPPEQAIDAARSAVTTSGRASIARAYHWRGGQSWREVVRRARQKSPDYVAL
jgi:hypothetical protein